MDGQAAFQRADVKEELSWNFALQAYRHSISDQHHGRILRVGEITKGANKNLQDLFKRGEVKFPDPAPTTAETTLEESGQHMVTWVGMIPDTVLEKNKDASSNDLDDADDATIDAPTPSKKSKPADKGQSVQTVQRYEVLPQAVNALRVGAVLGGAKGNESGNVLLYALIKGEKEDLCRAVGIDRNRDETFFFPRFVDFAVTNKKGRRENTSSLIRKCIQSSDGDGQLPSLAKHYDTTRIDRIDPKQNAVAELISHFTTYTTIGDPLALANTKALLDRMKSDRTAIDQNKVVQKLIDGQICLDEAEASELIRWFETMFPVTRKVKITQEEVRSLSEAICSARIAIELRVLRPIVLAWVEAGRERAEEEEQERAIEEAEAKSEIDQRMSDAGGPERVNYDAAKHVVQLVEYILHIFGPTACCMPGALENVDHDSFAAFLAADVKSADRFIDAMDRQSQAIKASQGKFAIVKNLPQLFTTLAEKTDVDSAKLYFGALQASLHDYIDTLVLQPVRKLLVDWRDERESMATLVAQEEESEEDVQG